MAEGCSRFGKRPPVSWGMGIGWGHSSPGETPARPPDTERSSIGTRELIGFIWKLSFPLFCLQFSQLSNEQMGFRCLQGLLQFCQSVTQELGLPSLGWQWAFPSALVCKQQQGAQHLWRMGLHCAPKLLWFELRCVSCFLLSGENPPLHKNGRLICLLQCCVPST